MLVVDNARNAQLQSRSRQSHAEVILPTALSEATLRAVGRQEKRLQTLFKEFTTHDEDGNSIGKRRDRVCVVTLLEVEHADVVDLGIDVARGCGYKTVQGLREDWGIRHPRSPRAVVVWFALGDWRDKDVFMNWSGAAGGDYVGSSRRSLDPDAPVLTREQIDALSAVNRQKDDARRAQASAAMATETLAQRYLRLQRATERMGMEARSAIRQHRRVIEQRVKRAEGRPDSPES
jgi:hypothetical protein